MKPLVTAMTVIAVLAASPASAQKASAKKASAQKMACTSENMAKFVTSSDAMPDSPGKAAKMKEAVAVNTAMSKGDMQGACKSYMRAQKMTAK